MGPEKGPVLYPSSTCIRTYTTRIGFHCQTVTATQLKPAASEARHPDACEEISGSLCPFLADLGYSAQFTGNVQTEVINEAAFMRFE